MPDSYLRSKTKAEAWVSLTDEQKSELKDVIHLWTHQHSLVIASIVPNRSQIDITFRTVPPEIGQRIIDIVDELYEGET